MLLVVWLQLFILCQMQANRTITTSLDRKISLKLLFELNIIKSEDFFLEDSLKSLKVLSERIKQLIGFRTSSSPTKEEKFFFRTVYICNSLIGSTETKNGTFKINSFNEHGQLRKVNVRNIRFFQLKTCLLYRDCC